ncbi:MAG: histidine--tRNA ligase [SAR324 cluster bacterium]|uniref:Histidine--tRNA ligase n=1 Tax=SAR324 cluster bacterium TaxID=2024889 RepID=A0A7X9IKH3_9DELT|nr:histidine--tRNA ligase [SAR324 cluster bacterium]
MGNDKAAYVEAKTLRGFRDKLPKESLVKGAMLAKLKGVFESFAYLPIETPHIEFLDVLVKQGSDEIQKQLYAFKDNGGRNIALRFDLTVPLARFIVQHRNEVGIPFKRYAIGEVFRGERPQAGRYREFTQCDFDFVGTTSIGSDAEIVQVIDASMKALGVKSYAIRVNNRKLMNGLAEDLGLSSKAADILRIVDKLDKIGADETRRELMSELSLKEQQISPFFELIELSQVHQGSALFAKLQKFAKINESLNAGISELERLTLLVEAANVDPSCFRVDFSIARGLGYYTGIVYETTLADLPEIGSVCSGGRYDNLTMTFSSEKLPGVGASVGIDRLIAALEQIGLSKQAGTPAKVLILNLDGELEAEIHSTAAQIRMAGINAEVYPEPSKQKKQFEYQERHGHPFVLFVQKDEAGNLQYTLRCTKTREQTILKSQAEIIESLMATK